ncbi:MAG: hypothetical protein K0Q72_715 [Armatimonadetes bacterium]|jgi:hypothetical protein|nr:hypothetical protein [Armatimonadota bacterium]
MRRRRAEPVETESGAVTVSFATAEDMVLQKLRWYRMGGETSERQWHDILGGLKVQNTALDLPYLDTWSAELGVSDLLTKILADAGLSQR